MKAVYLALALLWYQGATAEPIEVVTEASSYTYVENGKVRGPATEVVEETLKRARIDDYSLTLYPWARAINIAAQKRNVLIFPIVRTPERENLFEWVGQLSTVAVSLYKFRDRTDIKVADLESAKAYTIGVIRGDSRERYFHVHGFEKLVLTADNNESFRLFSLRQVQLIPMSERDAKALCQALHIPFDELEVVYTLHEFQKGIYMAYSKGTSAELVSRTVQAFQSLDESGALKKIMGE
jgi:polar amino acid transport system substrate-binding protein